MEAGGAVLGGGGDDCNTIPLNGHFPEWVACTYK